MSKLNPRPATIRLNDLVLISGAHDGFVQPGSKHWGKLARVIRIEVIGHGDFEARQLHGVRVYVYGDDEADGEIIVVLPHELDPIVDGLPDDPSS